MILIYTDGACSQNGTQNGGWGVVIKNSNGTVQEKISGGKRNTTNNEMELMAFLKALEYINNIETTEGSTIHTDSAYVYNAVTQGWIESWKSKGWRRPRNKELAHRDLWIRVDYLISQINERANLSFQKVKAHSNNFGNELADTLAVMERDKLNKEEL